MPSCYVCPQFTRNAYTLSVIIRFQFFLKELVPVHTASSRISEILNKNIATNFKKRRPLTNVNEGACRPDLSSDQYNITL